MKSGASAAKKWARNLAGAGESIREGVMAMTVNPAEKAAAQADVAVRKYALSKDKMVNGLRRITLQEIQQAMIKKGIPRITAGVADAEAKTARVLDQIIAHVESVKGSLPPRGSDAENDQRMLQFVAGMRRFKRS